MPFCDASDLVGPALFPVMPINNKKRSQNCKSDKNTPKGLDFKIPDLESRFSLGLLIRINPLDDDELVARWFARGDAKAEASQRQGLAITEAAPGVQPRGSMSNLARTSL